MPSEQETKRFTKWIWGVLVAAVAALLTTAFTGLLSSGASGVRGLVLGEDDPVTIVATRVPARASS